MRVWPGDAPFSWRSTSSLDEGAPFESTCFSASAHAGTHADAPAHVLRGGARAGSLDLKPYVGPARVMPLEGHGEVGPDSLSRFALGVSRVLFQTGGRAFLSPLAAIRLAEAGAILIGTDAASIDPPDAPDLPAPGMTRSYARSFGRLTLVAELRDSASGAIVMRLLDHVDGHDHATFVHTTRVENTREVGLVASEWARTLRRQLELARVAGEGSNGRP